MSFPRLFEIRSIGSLFSMIGRNTEFSEFVNAKIGCAGEDALGGCVAI